MTSVNSSTPGNQRKSRSLLELSNGEAREFLLKEESYCNFDLPPYIVFEELLADIDKILKGKRISDFQNGPNPRSFDDINYTILNNKDGKYAWRPLQLIHPALYVSLVHRITEEGHWNTICKRFAEFSDIEKIRCLSIPVESLTDEKDKAEQVSHWWQEIEQKSFELSLEYEYLVQTDISDCYESIYTHSIAWALHTKATAKRRRHDKALIGNIIDSHIQDMRHGQTNGIPQGSALMDLVAEMILGYADLKLSEKLQPDSVDDYYILRYRDDYRIFVNNPQVGEKIIKYITEIMIDLGLKLNPLKTKVSNQVIRDSVKGDKLQWMGKKQGAKSLQKHLLIIHNHAMQFPNSGSLVVALSEYHKRVSGFKGYKGNLLALIGIVVDIAFHNPRTYAISSAILSHFINMLEDNGSKTDILEKIITRFKRIPNTGHLQIWLQRITLPVMIDIPFDEQICKLVSGGNDQMIWNVDWITSEDLKKVFKPDKIINKDKINELTPTVTTQEVDLYIPKAKGYYM